MDFKLTSLINGLGLLKIPLLAFTTPIIVESSERRNEVRVRLNYRTKNHLGSMYFGALAMGAELSVALTAVTEIKRKKMKIDFLFKDFHCEFLKRADGHVHFICDESSLVSDLIDQSSKIADRLERKFSGYAVIPSKGLEPVMKYEITLSVKNRSFKI